MLRLDDVTLVAVGSAEYFEANQRSIDLSCKDIHFGVVRNMTIDAKSSDEYSHFILFELWKHIGTKYALIVQHDSHVLRPELWTKEFLEYDYIGAPWPPDTHFTPDGEEIRVGNGGFSLRSKQMLRAFTDLGLEFSDGGKGFAHEDGQICNYNRKALEDHGLKFAPVELAAQFSHELDVPETVLSFGFHRYEI